VSWHGRCPCAGCRGREWLSVPQTRTPGGREELLSYNNPSQEKMGLKYIR
jgi:hypothetical protein